MFTLPVSVQGKSNESVNIHFIFDTGAPVTYIARSSVAALGIQEWELNCAVILINGVRVSSDSQVVRNHDGSTSVCHFAGLDFIDQALGALHIDMSTTKGTKA